MSLHRSPSMLPKKGKAVTVLVTAAILSLVITLVFMTVVVAGAKEPTDPDYPVKANDPKGEDQTGGVGGKGIKLESAVELSNPISPDDFRVIAQYFGSYLAENSAGKKLLYMEGDAYQRGYAEGYLCPRSVERMAHDYLENVFYELVEDVGIGVDLRQFPALWELLWNVLKVFVASNQGAIPEEFRREMQGIADACRQQGYDVSYRDLLTLNAGIDTLESVYVGFGAIFCNEFAVFADATRDGRLYHGRDFMFTIIPFTQPDTTYCSFRLNSRK